MAKTKQTGAVSADEAVDPKILAEGPSVKSKSKKEKKSKSDDKD